MFVLSIHCEVPFSRERRRPILHHDPVLDSSFGVRRTQPQYEVFIPPEHDECLGFVGADGAAYTIAPLQSSPCAKRRQLWTTWSRMPDHRVCHGAYVARVLLGRLLRCLSSSATLVDTNGLCRAVKGMAGRAALPVRGEGFGTMSEMQR
jgi:hypothetical protein